jgi:hypothetical protein
MSQKISISQLEGGEQVLSGLYRGRSLYDKIVAQLPRTIEPCALFLDFNNVDLATGSYIREGVLKLKKYCRDEGLNIYPVMANISDQTVPELELALKAYSDTILVCTLDNRNRVGAARLLGVLEDKDLKTFQAVATGKEVDATSLAEQYAPQEKIGPTGWNNRLAGLVAKGIVMELRRGRAKFYRPVLEVAQWATTF